MARSKKREKPDAEVQQVVAALADYQHRHPNGRIEVRRQNPVSIRLRIIDPDFKGKDRVDREPEVWDLLKTLPEDVFVDITQVLLLTPTEAKKSLASQEFDDPIRSGL
jgi:stress-induced morphogen